MKSLRSKADGALRQRLAQRKLSNDFLNHALEWRRIFAEAWGTFLLVVVAAGGEVVAAKSGGAVTPGMPAVGPGLRGQMLLDDISPTNRPVARRPTPTRQAGSLARPRDFAV